MKNSDWWKNTSPDNWKWGLFYSNKDDNRLFVLGRKMGIGWTLNFSHSFAFLVVSIFFILIMISLYLQFNPA
jgi:uncharacterized membrane protein